MNSRNDYFDVLKNVSMCSKFHPVKDILDSLKWNGSGCIRRLLPDYLGAEDTEYTYQVIRLWIVPTGINEPKKSLFTSAVIEDMKAAWAEAVHIWKTEKPRLILPDSCREEAKRLQDESMADDGKILYQ